MPVTEGARTADRLEERARSLAARHRVLLERREGGVGLLSRLSEQQEILRHGRAHFAGSRQPEEYPPPPLAVWLLDNYYVLQQTFRLVREEMPPGYYRTLPKLGSAEGRGMPRVLAVAAEILHLGRTVVDLEEVRRFVRLYQESRRCAWASCGPCR